MRDPHYDILFEPVRIGPVTAPNRFFSVPHATGHNPLMPNGSIGMREMKAEGGWGVVSMQLAEIDPTSDISNLPIEKFWDDTDVKSHALLVERVKKHGALTAIELAHTGIRARNMDTGTPVLGPSSMRILKPQNPIQSKAMDKQDIKAFRNSHKRAVQRAKQAGYDMVYVYAAHDAALVWHFLSPMYNRRSDEYGGSFENRLRLLREVLEDTMEAAAGDLAVAVRIPAHDFKAGSPLTYDNEARAVIEALAEVPDLWDVNVAAWHNDSMPSRFGSEAGQEDYISFVKKLTDKPVVGVGRFTSPDTMVSQIRRGVLDLIGAARPSIADPFLPNKIDQGREDEIRECIGCNLCTSGDALAYPMRCTQNPTMGEEWRRGWHPVRIDKAGSADRVLIVGAGPAGLEAARALSDRGYDVVLSEACAEMGGRVIREASLAPLTEWRRVADHRIYMLGQRANVQTYTESSLAASDVLEAACERVVIATGSHWRGDFFGLQHQHPVPVAASARVMSADEILKGARPDGHILIYDDDHYYLASAIAEQLASNGAKVTLVTPESDIASWSEHTLEHEHIQVRLRELDVEIICNKRVRQIDAGEAVLECVYIGRESRVAADVVIPITSREPGDKLYQELLTEQPAWADNAVKSVQPIGDCLVPATIAMAVYAGHEYARNLDQAASAGTFRRELGLGGE